MSESKHIGMIFPFDFRFDTIISTEAKPQMATVANIFPQDETCPGTNTPVVFYEDSH